MTVVCYHSFGTNDVLAWGLIQTPDDDSGAAAYFGSDGFFC